MSLVLVALFMLMPRTFADNVSTKPGLKIFRDEYKSVKATCLDLGFAKKACDSGSYTEKKVVAFDVLLKNSISNLASNGRVVFETVHLNEGNGYDPSTGIFTAPAAGIYAFDWTILTMPRKYAYTSLVVNGKFKSWNHCYGGISKTNISCSEMTVVKLKQGDKVWIGVFNGPAHIFEKFTSFSGYNL